MFLKVTRSGPRRYLQLVESYRDDAGKPRQRTLVTLGRLDQLDGQLDSVISGLLKVTGRPDVLNEPVPEVAFESARALGDVWTLNELWKDLGFDAIRRVFRKTRHAIDIEALIRVMVFNRLCDPDSKLGVLRWLETVAMPDVEAGSVSHQHLLRAMDALEEHQAEVDTALMNEAERSAWCREHGLFVEQLVAWREACEADSTSRVTSSALAAERKKSRRLEKELQRKEKALAETAALLTLSKKAQAIWGTNEDN